MENKINELLNSVVRMAENEREIAYSSLQNQLKPHYLCNALDTIRSEANQQNLPHIAQSVELIISYFRYNMSDMRRYVTLQSELKNAMDYVNINNLIINNSAYRVKCDVEFDDRISGRQKDYYVLKFILQPIVENSIKHGFKNVAGFAKIIIRVTGDKDNVAFSVEDNGDGMKKSVLEEIKRKLEDVRIPHGDGEMEIDHMGLVNIKQRLQLNYGGKGIIEIESYAGVGTKVIVEMPIMTDISDEEMKLIASSGN